MQNSGVTPGRRSRPNASSIAALLGGKAPTKRGPQVLTFTLSFCLAGATKAMGGQGQCTFQNFHLGGASGLQTPELVARTSETPHTTHLFPSNYTLPYPFNVELLSVFDLADFSLHAFQAESNFRDVRDAARAKGQAIVAPAAGHFAKKWAREFCGFFKRSGPSRAPGPDVHRS